MDRGPVWRLADRPPLSVRGSAAFGYRPELDPREDARQAGSRSREGTRVVTVNGGGAGRRACRLRPAAAGGPAVYPRRRIGPPPRTGPPRGRGAGCAADPAPGAPYL